jgi:hypothetical protein
LLAEFPDITEQDIGACLAFAADRERKLHSELSMPSKSARVGRQRWASTSDFIRAEDTRD